jgi:uncharacterized protein YpiB (UPF0302 family)
MILFYRRHKDTLDPEWHFHTDCPRWPDTNFVQMHFINPEMNERFCEDCANLEAAMFPSKNPRTLSGKHPPTKI